MRQALPCYCDSLETPKIKKEIPSSVKANSLNIISHFQSFPISSHSSNSLAYTQLPLSPQPDPLPNPPPQLPHISPIPILHPRRSPRILHRAPEQILHALLHRSPRQTLVHQRHRNSTLLPQSISPLQNATPKFIGHSLQLPEFRLDLQFPGAGEGLHEVDGGVDGSRVVACEEQLDVGLG